MNSEAPQLTKIITVFATPSSFTNFLFSLVQHLLRATVEKFDQVIASEVHQIQNVWASRRHKHVLLFCDCPERPLVETYLKTNGRALFFLDDPREVASFLMTQGNMQPAWAVRATEQTAVALIDLTNRDHVLQIQRSDLNTAGDFFRKVAQFLDLSLTASAFDRLRGSLVHITDSLDVSVEELSRRYSRLAREPSPTVHPAVQLEGFEPFLSRLRRMFTDGRPSVIDWPVSMFIDPSAQDEEFQGTIDLLGPARCVLYGPYLYLPYGYWRLNALIEVTGNTSGNELQADVYQSSAVASATANLPSEGQLALEANFHVSEPRTAIQLRLITLQGAIEGRITLKGVKIHPQQITS